jgi:hypothetical protein
LRISLDLNKYLPEFLEEINKKFGKEAANPEDAHRKLRKKDDLQKLFRRKEKRTLSKNLTMQHKGILYQIETKSPNRMKHAKVDVYTREGEAIEIEYNGVKLKYNKWSDTIYERPPRIGP